MNKSSKVKTVNELICTEIAKIDSLMPNLNQEQKAEFYKQTITVNEASIANYRRARTDLEVKALELLEIESALELFLDELRKAALQVGPVGGVQ